MRTLCLCRVCALRILCAHNEMSAPKPNRTKDPTNIGIEPELKRVASRYFIATKYGSLSGFVNAQLRREFAKGASVIRAIGLTVPQSVTQKGA